MREREKGGEGGETLRERAFTKREKSPWKAGEEEGAKLTINFYFSED